MPKYVLAVVPEAGERLGGAGGEAVQFALDLATALDAKPAILLLGADPAGAATEAAERGMDLVAVAATPELATQSGERAVALVEELAGGIEVAAVVVARGPAALEIVPRVACRLGGGAVLGVVSAKAEAGELRATVSAYGGAARAVFRMALDAPPVLGLAPTAQLAASRQAGRAAEAIDLTAEAKAFKPRVRVVEEPAASTGPRLEDARVVVSGGRGIKDRTNYPLIRELAAAMGGMPGASRAIVDEAWADPLEQVGLTGKIVTPDIYLAIGISGASQHLAGCSNSRFLVAINTDPDAPIFRYAKLGIVGDSLAMIPELLRQVREAPVPV